MTFSSERKGGGWSGASDLICTFDIATCFTFTILLVWPLFHIQCVQSVLNSLDTSMRSSCSSSLVFWYRTTPLAQALRSWNGQVRHFCISDESDPRNWWSVNKLCLKEQQRFRLLHQDAPKTINSANLVRMICFWTRFTRWWGLFGPKSL